MCWPRKNRKLILNKSTGLCERCKIQIALSRAFRFHLQNMLKIRYFELSIQPKTNLYTSTFYVPNIHLHHFVGCERTSHIHTHARMAATKRGQIAFTICDVNANSFTTQNMFNKYQINNGLLQFPRILRSHMHTRTRLICGAHTSSHITFRGRVKSWHVCAIQKTPICQGINQARNYWDFVSCTRCK